MRRPLLLLVGLALALAPAATAAGSGSVTASVASGWSATPIAAGIKPALALDRKGQPAIAYLQEALSGFVAYASAAAGWKPETIARGYFYGPIGLAFDAQSRPNVVYHDHQGQTAVPTKGALTYALKNGSRWQVSPAPFPGHAGWDSTIAIASDGVVRAAGIIPSQFGFNQGVLYYELQKDGRWRVTPVGSGPIAYEFNVGLAVDPTTKRPALTYYNDRTGDLEYASFDGARWKIETVAAPGDQGKFSSLAFDAKGRPHVTFFAQTADTTGTIRYAVRDGGKWKLEDVAKLTNVVIGMTGARRNSSLALDEKGVPHVAFADTKAVYYAVRGSSGWKVDKVATAGKLPFGQLVSLQLGKAGKADIATFEVTGQSPELTGEVELLTQK